MIAKDMFKDVDGVEIFTERVTNQEATVLIPCLCFASVKVGIDRVTRAIKATYTKRDANQIINNMNIFMDLMTN